MKVLACGGRDYSDRAHVFQILDLIHARRPITLLIEGGARGADRLAREWAICTGVPYVTYEANWRIGRFAGQARNLRMLKEGRPDFIVAFPGGAGTSHMRKIGRAAGICVYTPFVSNPHTPLQRDRPDH